MSDPQRSHGIHPNVILGVTALGGLAYSMLSSAVISALPSIQHSLHSTETGVTWLLTGYLLSLIDMSMMRRRGVWTTNLVAFLVGGGMYGS